MQDLSEYTKIKYLGDCHCGKCHLVPVSLIFDAAAAHRLMFSALKDLLAANNAVRNAMDDGPDVPGFDPSILSKAQAAVTSAEKRAQTAIYNVENAN